MPRHPDPVTVALPIGAALLRRLVAVAADRHLDRPEALHAALLCWLEQEERTTARSPARLHACAESEVLTDPLSSEVHDRWVQRAMTRLAPLVVRVIPARSR